MFNSPFVLVFLILASNVFIKTRSFNPSSSIKQANYLNKSDTDVELDILFSASPKRFEILKT